MWNAPPIRADDFLLALAEAGQIISLPATRAACRRSPVTRQPGSSRRATSPHCSHKCPERCSAMTNEIMLSPSPQAARRQWTR
jgi:hypothetical protein